MIIDLHVHVGRSIFGYEQEADPLLDRMDRHGIDMSVVSPVQPFEYHLEPANSAVAELVHRHPGRLIGFGRVDPRQGTLALREMERCKNALGLRGIFLHPWEEGYPINSGVAIAVVRHAASLDLPVLIAAGFPWVSHALQVADLAMSVPEATLIMSHGGQINISGLAQADAFAALETCPNLSHTTSGVYRQDFLETVVARHGANRVFFGSYAPVLDQGFELARVRSLRIAIGDRERVLGGNAARLLKVVNE